MFRRSLTAVAIVIATAIGLHGQTGDGFVRLFDGTLSGWTIDPDRPNSTPRPWDAR